MVQIFPLIDSTCKVPHSPCKVRFRKIQFTLTNGLSEDLLLKLELLSLLHVDEVPAHAGETGEGEQGPEESGAAERREGHPPEEDQGVCESRTPHTLLHSHAHTHTSVLHGSTS